MDIKFVRARGRHDWVHVTRDDGSGLKWPWTKAGDQPPHDLMHFLIEGHLPLRNGFWDLVADGVDFGFLSAEADRIARGVPPKGLAGRDLGGLVLAECVVAGITTATWVDADDEQCLTWVDQQCRSRNLSRPDMLTATTLHPVRARIREVVTAWRRLPLGESLDVTYPPSTG
ncbi:hypothetical protein [Nonomuraea sp. NPDC049784]|uniref:hypothetical protein n=1 Tax=Nonomuraea sp. NPDC049784 TaxID=3154361 RepID=UPI00340B7BCD